MRSLTALLLLLALPAMARAQTVERVNILDYGVYTANLDAVEPMPGTAAGDIKTLSNFKLLRQAETITAKPGLRFGIRYVVVGKPKGKVVTLTWVTRFPPGGLVNTKGEKFEKNEFERTIRIGEISYRTYTFDESWEVVPGDWNFEFWYRGEKIGEKRFKIEVP